tara:strand:- start:119 stop:505 length:387 start_codon:yes stop_codon:yes gene_type:complete
MRESIDKIVREGNWAFSQLLKLNDICEDIAQDYYSSLDASKILELVWDDMGQSIKNECVKQIKEEFMASFQRSFETATVKFDSPTQERLTQESITEEVPPLPKAKEDKPLKTFKSDDGTDMPKGVKRV